ncbi:ABC transporter substrate-binding protein [Paenibacillus macquariensis]|uniref:Carbohydrate ABC transporter substrate-binding protein, CUT1 family n=1 Tax=Paenibacillus macquariensis TaxID=948756 RepID=A0ABY1K5S3_9BACL|nr:extracellular solute-binding protein [Paenibacillus macquariensis]MEC0090505.1 extracellular solute-binding protein [Paenibacillus macquariensis]OAB38506.1 ABC transporter substrate-binding protein [Paenibacillus macquariensis subsp. macquariensis]SIR30316.1 carbohydrate ABC transporter substrate-binding protein, CUT1 family [Paenibacillus macquariensis]
MINKKMAAVSIAALMAVSLVGCGGSNNAAPKEEVKEPVKEEVATPTSTPTEPEATKLTGDFEIQYFVGGYGDKWWKKVIAEFQAANPDLKVKESGGPKINDQMKPRWIGGTPPDFVYIDGAGLNDRQMVEDDQLEDLTDWLKDAKNIDGDLIKDILAQPAQEFDGKVYNIPLVLNSWGMFWNKALFKEKGWAEPTDFDSFLAVSEKIKADGVTPFIHTGKYPYYINGSVLYPAIVSANNDDFSILQDMAANKVEAFESPAVLTALNKIVALRDKGFIDKASIQINHTDSQMLFLQNKDAFIPNGLWLPNEMSKDVPAGFEFGFIPSVTQSAGGKVVANTSTATVAIAKKAKNKDAAKAFLQFIFSKGQASQWAELSGAPSNIKGDISASNAPSHVKDAAKYLTDPNTVVIPTITYNADVDKAMMDATDALTISTITPEEWVKRVTDVVKKVSK